MCISVLVFILPSELSRLFYTFTALFLTLDAVSFSSSILQCLLMSSFLFFPCVHLLSTFAYIVSSSAIHLSYPLFCSLTSHLSSFQTIFPHLFIHLLTSPFVCTFCLIPHAQFFNPCLLLITPSHLRPRPCLPCRSWIINHPPELECCCNTLKNSCRKLLTLILVQRYHKGFFSGC